MLSEEEAVTAMEHCIAVYAQRIHQGFQGHLVSWTVEDLQQEGRLAVTLAWRRFDPTRAAFPTYARPRIWGAMWDYVRRVRPGTRHLGVVCVAIEDLPGGIDSIPDVRPTGVVQVEARLSLRALHRVPYCASTIGLLWRHIGAEEELAPLGRAVGLTTNAMRNRLRRCLRRLQAAVREDA